MKKLSILVLITILSIFTLAACGKSNQMAENDFAGIIRDVNLSMTKEDIMVLEREDSGAEATAEEIFEGDTILYYKDAEVAGYPGILTYRIEKEGTLGFVQFEFEKSEDYDSFMEDFQSQYGEPSKTEDYYEVWYGMLGGKKAMFTASEDMSLIELAKKK